MKTLSLCAVGLAAGIGLAAATQYPVLETLGYLPEDDTSEVVVDDSEAIAEPSTALADADLEERPNRVKNETIDETAQGADEKVADAGSRKTSGSQKIMSKSNFNDFEHGVFTHNGFDLPYRLRRPQQSEAKTKPSPLVVFLHGAGERGDDNEAHLKNGCRDLADWLDDQSLDAFVLFPQCPKGEQWAAHKWSETSHSMQKESTKSMAALLALLDNIMDTEQIDDSRIYATGISMGGFGVFDLVARRQDVFAAAAPLCGGTDANPESLKKLTSTPLYIVHGSADPVVDVTNSRKVVAGLKTLESSPVYIELPGVWHDCWTQTYADSTLFEWMFSKARTHQASTQTAKSADKTKGDSVDPTSAKRKVDNEASSKSPSIAKRTSEPSADSKQRMKSQKVVVAKPPIKDVPGTKTSRKQGTDLAGKWIVIRAVHAGSQVPIEKLKSMTIEFSSDQIVIEQGSKREIGKLETRNSNSIGDTSFAELTITSAKSDKGEIRGFYYFDADELTMIWGAPGADRPDPTDREKLAEARILTLQSAD